MRLFFGHPPPAAHSLAPFPISDCGCRLHLPRGLPVCILEAEAADIFLPPSSPFMNSLLCGEAPLKAASVPASMCALYSCVCVYASASYGCFPPPWPRPGCGSRRAPECCLCAILISGEVSGSKNVQRYCGNSALLPAP